MPHYDFNYIFQHFFIIFQDLQYKNHQKTPKPIKNHQNQSKITKTSQKSPKPVKKHQNQSKITKTNQTLAQKECSKGNLGSLYLVQFLNMV